MVSFAGNMRARRNKPSSLHGVGGGSTHLFCFPGRPVGAPVKRTQARASQLLRAEKACVVLACLPACLHICSGNDEPGPQQTPVGVIKASQRGFCAARPSPNILIPYSSSLL